MNSYYNSSYLGSDVSAGLPQYPSVHSSYQASPPARHSMHNLASQFPAHTHNRAPLDPYTSEGLGSTLGSSNFSRFAGYDRLEESRSLGSQQHYYPRLEGDSTYSAMCGDTTLPPPSAGTYTRSHSITSSGSVSSVSQIRRSPLPLSHSDMNGNASQVRDCTLASLPAALSPGAVSPPPVVAPASPLSLQTPTPSLDKVNNNNNNNNSLAPPSLDSGMTDDMGPTPRDSTETRKSSIEIPDFMPNCKIKDETPDPFSKVSPVHPSLASPIPTPSPAGRGSVESDLDSSQAPASGGTSQLGSPRGGSSGVPAASPSPAAEGKGPDSQPQPQPGQTRPEDAEDEMGSPGNAMPIYPWMRSQFGKRLNPLPLPCPFYFRQYITYI